MANQKKIKAEKMMEHEICINDIKWKLTFPPSWLKILRREFRISKNRIMITKLMTPINVETKKTV